MMGIQEALPALPSGGLYFRGEVTHEMITRITRSRNRGDVSLAFIIKQG